MKVKATRLLAGSIAVALGFTLAACSLGADSDPGANNTGGQTSGDAGGGEAELSGSIRIFTPYSPYDPMLEAAADAYMAQNPDAQIAVESAPYEGYETALQTQFIGQTAPDLLLLEPPAITSFSQRGFLADLTDHFASDGWSDVFLDSTLTEIRALDGKDYAAPWAVINLKQMYRSDILADLGFEPPMTWAEDIEISQAANDAGILPRWYSLAGNDAGLWWRLTLILNAGFRTITDEINLKGAEIPYDPTNPDSLAGQSYEADELYVAFRNGLIDPARSDIYREAMEIHMQLKGLTGDGMAWDPEARNALILTGEMLFNDGQDADKPLFYSNAEEAGVEEFEIDFVQFPPVTEAEWPRLTAGPSNPLAAVRNGMAVNASTEHPDLAVDFLRFLTSVEGQNILYENNWDHARDEIAIGQVSAINGVTYDPDSGLQPIEAELTPELTLYGFGMPPTFDPQDMDEFHTQFQNLWLDNITLDEFLEQRSASNLAALERNLEVYADTVDQAFIDEHLDD